MIYLNLEELNQISELKTNLNNDQIINLLGTKNRNQAQCPFQYQKHYPNQ